MTRLTKDLKDYIVNAAVAKSGLETRLSALQEEKFDWAEAVRVESLGGAITAGNVAKLEAQIKTLVEKLPKAIGPQDGLTRRHYTRFHFGGSVIYANYRAPALGGRDLSLDGAHPLVERYLRIKGDLEGVYSAIRELRVKTLTALDLFSTVNALIKSWPEVKELLPEGYGKKASTALAVPFEALNVTIGLPSN